MRVHEADETCKKESVNEEDVRAEHDACVRARRVLCSTPGCKDREKRREEAFFLIRSYKYSQRVFSQRSRNKNLEKICCREVEHEFEQNSQKCATR